MGIRTELSLRLPNSPGALAGVCRLLADERVSVVALSLGAPGQLRLIVDNPGRAASALRARHHQVTEREVLVIAVGSGPDALAPVLALIGDAGVNLEYAYGATSAPPSQGTLVLGVDDAMRAASMTGT